MTAPVSDEGQKPALPQPPDGLWLICPVCKKLSPAGTDFCQHCWGASLNSVKPMMYEEAVTLTQQLVRSKKQHRMMRIALIVILPILITVGAAFLYI